MSNVSKYQHIELWNCCDRDDIRNCCMDIADELLTYARNIDLMGNTQTNERTIDTIFTCLGRHMFGTEIWTNKELNELLSMRVKRIQEDYKRYEIAKNE